MNNISKIEGYKAFFSNHTNRHGKEFCEGNTYKTNRDISFGNDSFGGYHMCKRLEDTLRYFPPKELDISIACVTGSGKIIEFEDNYYGYYDMYSVEEITIKKFLTRDEVVGYYLIDNNYLFDERICRFIQLFNLNPIEIEMFKDKYYNRDLILKYIKYYYEKDREVFKRKIKSRF